jgi:preprotein translocase subunit SecD
VPTDDWSNLARERVMSQVLEVLQRRVADPIQGIRGPVVTRRGTNRILVRWYNPHRRHSSIDYQSPIPFERINEAAER